MVLQRFADYAAGVRDDAVPPEAVHAAKRCVIDWFASVIPGGAQPPATLLREAFADDLGHGRAVLYPSGLRAPARSAALITGPPPTPSSSTTSTGTPSTTPAPRSFRRRSPWPRCGASGAMCSCSA